jgi:UDP-2,3-diacylglucosamine hydrolase
MDGFTGRISRIALAPRERVWVTGDVHLDPDDAPGAVGFLAFLAAAQRDADRLCILGDLFDYWLGERHGRACAYAPVLDALARAAKAGFPIDFLCGNRDFLSPEGLARAGLHVQGDVLLYARGDAATLVTHGDRLVAGDVSYQRYRRVVRSAPAMLLYRAIPLALRLWLAERIRGISRRKLRGVAPYAYPIDLARAAAWLRHTGARQLLMGHLHREERHALLAGTVHMLPAWSTTRGPYYLLGPPAELRSLALPASGAEVQT